MVTDKFAGQVIVDRVHHMTHTGYLFEGVYTTTIGANTTAQILIRTAASSREKEPHAIFGVSATGAGQASLFKSPSISTSTGQSTITFVNHDLVSANTAGVTMYGMPTENVGTTVGTLLNTRIIGGGTAGPGVSGATIGGVGESRQEWILDHATTYLIQYHNGNGANTTNVSLDMVYYPARIQ